MATGHPLSPSGITHVLLDTNAMLPPRLSDVLFDLCLEGLFSARWTADIEVEFTRNWPKVVANAAKGGAPLSAQQSAAETAKAERRMACYKGAVPGHEIFGYDLPAVLDRVPGAVAVEDKHVAAAGLVLLDYARLFDANDKVYIVSSNLKHFAAADMKRLGILVVSPGEFIDSLAQADSTRVGLALDKSVNSLKNPPYSRELLLGALLVHGAKGAAQHCADAWGEKLPSPGPAR
ncbi:hypothetical protein CSQ96_26375 [Janthinobacterium sp. BJB412]|nr:hypothetical protein CSQ96_26375 [Janthinobacterium sp. BJB412]